MADDQKKKSEFSSWTEQEVREEQTHVYAKMKGLQQEADKREGDQKGVFNAEDNTRWDTLNERYDDLGEELKGRDEIRKAQLSAEIRRQQLDELNQKRSQGYGRRTEPDSVKAIKDPNNRDEEVRDCFYRKWLEARGNQVRLNPTEQRALQVDVDTIGGNLVPNETFVNMLIKFVDDNLWMRQFADVISLTDAESAGIPSWDTDPADADWTSELGTGDADSAAAVGKRHLTPRPLAKRILISRTLIRKSAIPIVNLVTQRLGYKFAVTEEKAFLTGTGANQPLGVFTASSNGISTTQDVSTANTATNITADGLIEAKYALKEQYMKGMNTRWIFHRDAVKRIRKLKDGNGDYLWSRGLGGTPDSILDIPYHMSEYAPNTFTASQYVGIIGDFSKYTIVEAMRMEVQRLDELYAATNQVGLICRMELDGMPTLEEAFVRVTLGS